MSRILIVYHSRGGSTRRMAEAVVMGAASIENATVLLRQASDATIEDLFECDGLVIGSPEYFGYMAGMVKDFFDRTYEAGRGRKEVFRKPYAVFISAANDGSGTLASIERICIRYPFKKVLEPVIARGTIDVETLGRCEELGKTIAAGCEAGIY
jgi:multimeric flavodoxin WrbA